MSRLGDKMSVAGRLGVRHYGIYVGQIGGYLDAVVHNSKTEMKVVLEELSTFADGKEIKIEQHAPPDYEQVVVERALQLLGTKYDLIDFNCEHFVNLVQQGERRSDQLRNGAFLGGLALGVAWLYNSSRPRFDERVARYRDSLGRFTSG